MVNSKPSLGGACVQNGREAKRGRSVRGGSGRPVLQGVHCVGSSNEVMIGRRLVDTAKSGNTASVRVFDPGDEPLVLDKGNLLGCFNPVAQSDIVRVADCGSDPTSQLGAGAELKAVEVPAHLQELYRKIQRERESWMLWRDASLQRCYLITQRCFQQVQMISVKLH